MGGITFLDYVKELPKGKREAKGATKGGYATSAPAQKKPAAANGAVAPAAAAAAPAPAPAVESTARGLSGVEESKGGGGSEADAIGDKIAAKVGAPWRMFSRPCLSKPRGQPLPAHPVTASVRSGKFSSHIYCLRVCCVVFRGARVGQAGNY